MFPRYSAAMMCRERTNSRNDPINYIDLPGKFKGFQEGRYLGRSMSGPDRFLSKHNGVDRLTDASGQDLFFPD